jgi:hypothetical protein
VLLIGLNLSLFGDAASIAGVLQAVRGVSFISGCSNKWNFNYNQASRRMLSARSGIGPDLHSGGPLAAAGLIHPRMKGDIA